MTAGFPVATFRRFRTVLGKENVATIIDSIEFCTACHAIDFRRSAVVSCPLLRGRHATNSGATLDAEQEADKRAGHHVFICRALVEYERDCAPTRTRVAGDGSGGDRQTSKRQRHQRRRAMEMRARFGQIQEFPFAGLVRDTIGDTRPGKAFVSQCAL